MKMKIYKVVLMFMVALAVGTLAGSGLLVLIPEVINIITIVITIIIIIINTIVMAISIAINCSEHCVFHNGPFLTS